MRTDHLFYKLFQAFPETLFQLIGLQPPAPGSYSFDAVEVKQTALRIDGVFVPSVPREPYYFVEVQFQKDKDIYWRLCTELLLYMRGSAPEGDWRAVLIFAGRHLDVEVPATLSGWAADVRFGRVYLDELVVEEDSPLGLSLVRLVVEQERTFPARARRLLERTRERLPAGEARQRALELIETIIVYKLRYGPEALRAMFTLDELENTPYVQGLKAQARREAGREARLSLVLRQLDRRVGVLEPGMIERIGRLPDERLDALAEALLDFGSAADLQSWLDSQMPG
ncbi:DUF2887 domain-containing protein [Gloeobacter morelensis]|uniref:DUF2887 domain-containing protein n=1 Tax=Gloeobacter morelensis MG652769 TaxID=2781736 RepID=A0ABY3PMC1_9CYAN|nr:DUF2887 domain-containing protein [Gloeobacter morelensis]UFP94765.1 DUF2887 domain-containing protein [Gloeobacter morelensis MG652769]